MSGRQVESCSVLSLLGVWRENTSTVEVGTSGSSTHAVCKRHPVEHCKPACKVLRRELEGVASILAMCSKNVNPLPTFCIWQSHVCDVLTTEFRWMESELLVFMLHQLV